MVDGINRDINALIPEFKSIVEDVILFLRNFNIPMEIFETLRTKERQRILYDKEYSKTLNSKHIIGEAADFVVKVDGKWSWDYKKYKILYEIYGSIAKHFGAEYGGDWKSFKDYPHIQLKRRKRK